MEAKNNIAKLSVCGFGTAFGVIWGLSMLLLAWLAASFDLGLPLVDLFGSLYVGFSADFGGAFIGLGWGLLDGFIFGALLAVVYNLSVCYCKCPYCKKVKSCEKCD